MQSFTYLVSFILTSMGLTVLIVWPEGGPSGWLRERILRPILPGRAKGVLDCYVCMGFWCGLLLSPLWWWFCGEPWVWTGGLMNTALLWYIVEQSHPTRSDHPAGGNHCDSESPSASVTNDKQTH